MNAFRRRFRFTLVELMITVAIVALLAAIAIPALHTAQSNSKVAETTLLGEAIMDAGNAYNATGTWSYGTDDIAPVAFPNGYGRAANPWVEAYGFYTGALGFRSDGPVRAVYAVSLTGDQDDCVDASSMAGRYVPSVWIYSDVDGDGVDRITVCCGTTPGDDYDDPGIAHRLRGRCAWFPEGAY